MPVTPSKVTVSRLKNKLLRPALTSHFLCEFGIPGGYAGQLGIVLDEWQKFKERDKFAGKPYTSEFSEDLQILCAEASLPGSSLLTNEINNDYTGVTERHAYRRSYDDRADFTFYVSEDYSIINFFEGWISYIAHERVDDDSPESPDAGFGLENPDYNYRMRFPKDYQTNSLYITKFERSALTGQSSSTLRYKFFKAFPISINSMPVSYDSSQLLKCTVSFTYSRYLITKESVGSPFINPQFGVDTTGQFGQTGFNITRTPTNVNPATGGNLVGTPTPSLSSNRPLTPTEIRQGVRQGGGRL